MLAYVLLDYESLVPLLLAFLYEGFCISHEIHVAAQYGQAAFLNHIISKYNADFDAPDNDGRSPLHWYAWGTYLGVYLT